MCIVSMCIYVYVCMCIGMYLYLYSIMYICMCICLRMCMCICVYMYTCACAYIYMYMVLCIYVCVYVCECIYVNVCMYAYMCIHYTHSHMHKQSNTQPWRTMKWSLQEKWMELQGKMPGKTMSETAHFLSYMEPRNYTGILTMWLSYVCSIIFIPPTHVCVLFVSLRFYEDKYTTLPNALLCRVLY